MLSRVEKYSQALRVDCIRASYRNSYIYKLHIIIIDFDNTQRQTARCVSTPMRSEFLVLSPGRHFEEQPPPEPAEVYTLHEHFFFHLVVLFYYYFIAAASQAEETADERANNILLSFFQQNVSLKHRIAYTYPCINQTYTTTTRGTERMLENKKTTRIIAKSIYNIYVCVLCFQGSRAYIFRTSRKHGA